jgi:hypothetical protein
VSDLDDLNALAAAYDHQVHQIRAQLEEFGRQVWASLPNYRDAAIDSMVEAIVPRVVAGQLQTAQITRAYMAECARALGWKLNVPPVDEQEVTGSRGVDPSVVYRRPAVTTYTALSEGKALPEAVKAGGLRLLQIIGGDMQLSKRAQSHHSMRAMGAQYYRRILTGRENCALCVVASTQRYHVKDLAAIHPGCDCNSGPLPPELAMDQVIDPDTLERAHAIVEERTGMSDRGARLPDYRKVIMTTTHGEYGPVLAWKGTLTEVKAAKRANKMLAAGGVKLPRTPRGGNRVRGGADEPEWKRRQAALKSSIPAGEALYPQEIEFLERFEERGERARWIARDRASQKSTNDFVWLTNDELVCELKTKSDSYSSIKKTIHTAVLGAKKHDVVKDVFVVDLGARKLSDKLRRQLSLYNSRVEQGQIRRLFVMSDDGRSFEEISLQ